MDSDSSIGGAQQGAESPPPDSISSQAEGKTFSKAFSAVNEGIEIIGMGCNPGGCGPTEGFRHREGSGTCLIGHAESSREGSSCLSDLNRPSPGMAQSRRNQTEQQPGQENHDSPKLQSSLSLFQNQPNARLEGRKWGTLVPCHKVEATTLDPLRAVPRERCGHTEDQAVPGVL